MRRHLISIVFAGLLGSAAQLTAGPAPTPREAAVAPVAVQRVRVPASGIRDEAAMVLVGTALIALGAAVRRVAA